VEKKYKNIGYCMILLVPLTFAGYYKSYISQIPKFNDYIRPAHHIHAFVAFLWLVLLISQSFLIRYKKVKTHRLVGKFSYFLFAILILSFFPIIHTDSIIIFPIADMILLIVFYSLGIIYKKVPAKHMRYMIALSLVFLDPTLGRIVFNLSNLMGYNTLAVHHITLGTISAILVGLIFFDKANNRNYKPYVFALSLFLVYQMTFHIIYIQ
jgi:hypothetical protein